MNRAALVTMVVAIGVLVLAGLQFARFSTVFESDGVIRASIGPPDARAGTMEHIEARSGAIDYRQVDARLQMLMRDPAMIGLAVAVVENGEVTFARGYGETLNGSGEPVTPETVFRWASLSKGVAATMLALLENDGVIRLDAPVGRYAPSLRLPAGGHMQATVEDLLAHRLGIVRNAWDARLENDESPFMLRLGMSQLARACVPGTCYRYQNVAFDAASEIVDEVNGGKGYEAAVAERLLEPLGMTSASLSMEGLQASASWARSHSRSGAEIEVVEPYYRVPAAGGMNGSVLDLATWMQAQFGQAPEVIPPGILAKTQAPMIRTEREDRRMRRYEGRLTNSHYGLGWRLYDYAGRRVVGHRGAVRGYRAMILFDPARRAGVAVLSNSDSGRAFDIPLEIFDQLYGLPDADWIGRGAPEGLAAPAPSRPPAATDRRRPGVAGEPAGAS